MFIKKHFSHFLGKNFLVTSAWISFKLCKKCPLWLDGLKRVGMSLAKSQSHHLLSDKKFKVTPTWSPVITLSQGRGTVKKQNKKKFSIAPDMTILYFLYNCFLFGKLNQTRTRSYKKKPLQHYWFGWYSCQALPWHNPMTLFSRFTLPFVCLIKYTLRFFTVY